MWAWRGWHAVRMIPRPKRWWRSSRRALHVKVSVPFLCCVTLGIALRSALVIWLLQRRPHVSCSDMLSIVVYSCVYDRCDDCTPPASSGWDCSQSQCLWHWWLKQSTMRDGWWYSATSWMFEYVHTSTSDCCMLIPPNLLVNLCMSLFEWWTTASLQSLKVTLVTGYNFAMHFSAKQEPELKKVMWRAPSPHV